MSFRNHPINELVLNWNLSTQLVFLLKTASYILNASLNSILNKSREIYLQIFLVYPWWLWIVNLICIVSIVLIIKGLVVTVKIGCTPQALWYSIVFYCCRFEFVASVEVFFELVTNWLSAFRQAVWTSKRICFPFRVLLV